MTDSKTRDYRAKQIAEEAARRLDAMSDGKTCHNASHYASEFRCSNCGATWLLEDYEFEPTLWLDGVACYPRYCQLCGMEIREDEEDDR